jgi:hypothetical protein
VSPAANFGNSFVTANSFSTTFIKFISQCILYTHFDFKNPVANLQKKNIIYNLPEKVFQ